MKRNTIETVLGAVVLLVAAGFLWLAYGAGAVHSSQGIRISAGFGSVGSLGVGDDVRISGINVGKVIETELDPEKFRAQVVFSIDERIRVPVDSSARIASSSLLGGNHVEIIPGFEEDAIADGGVIYDTRDPVSLTDILGKAVFGGSSSGQ